MSGEDMAPWSVPESDPLADLREVMRLAAGPDAFDGAAPPAAGAAAPAVRPGVGGATHPEHRPHPTGADSTDAGHDGEPAATRPGRGT